MLTRRRFLILFPAFAASAEASFAQLAFRKKKPPLPPMPNYVYFGTDTAKGVSKGIYRSKFDRVKGMLTPPELVAETRRPSFMAFTPMRSGKPRFMYAVNAVPDASATVTSFAVDGRTGGLKEIGRVTSAGAGPCYVSVDDTGSSAYVGNYMGSSIASYRIQADGTLSAPVERLDFNDAKEFGHVGPNSARQDAPHPHSAMI